MTKQLKKMMWAAAVSTGLLAAPAFAQVEVVVGPPPAFRATTAPVYFEGRPAYWYGGRWYYREGRDWRFYHEEPAYLHEWRGRREPVRTFYGREHGGGYIRHR